MVDPEAVTAFERRIEFKVTTLAQRKSRFQIACAGVRLPVSRLIEILPPENILPKSRYA
jgi:hypothetical protein